MIRLSREFGVPGLIQEVGMKPVAEIASVLQNPNDLLAWSDFYRLWSIPGAAAYEHDRITVAQSLHHLGRSDLAVVLGDVLQQLVPQVIHGCRPHGLSIAVNFDTDSYIGRRDRSSQRMATSQGLSAIVAD